MRFLLLSILFTLNGGCFSHPVDISNDARIRDLKLIGRQIVLTTDTPLRHVGGRYDRLLLSNQEVQKERGGPGSVVAVVQKDTVLTIVKIELGVVYYDGLYAISEEIVLARIERGSRAGDIVDTGLGEFSTVESLKHGTLPSDMYAWRPVTQR